MGYEATPWRSESEVIESAAAEFDSLQERLRPFFKRQEPHQTACDYLQALLSNAERKNSWGLAEESGRSDPYGFQHLLLRAKWEADALRDEALLYARESLGEGGILAVDETGFLKKGDKSAGVARQYTGTTGRIDNCQTGVFLAYITQAGHALVDRDLYLPEEWFADRARCEEAGIPAKTEFRTKPQLALQMLQHTFDSGLKPSWVVADEVYGRDGTLRRALEQKRQPYVVAVAANSYVWRGIRHIAPSEVLTSLGESEWQRLSCGKGAKGPRVYDWARVKINMHRGLGRWLLFRRNIGDPEDVAYYLVYGPEKTSLEKLAEVAGKRWPIEECFESAKGEVGLADYEVRSWTGWYRHMTLCLLAHIYLAAVRAKANGSEIEPPKRRGPPSRRSAMKRFLKRQGLSSATASRR
jgi:SRSO17 transposase